METSLCNWFVDNKLSIHFEEDKTKCILFGTKKWLKKDSNLDIRYGTVYIEQYHTVSILVAYYTKAYQENQRLCRSIRKSILDSDFCIRKIDFCLNHFVDFSVMQ